MTYFYRLSYGKGRFLSSRGRHLLSKICVAASVSVPYDPSGCRLCANYVRGRS